MPLNLKDLQDPQFIKALRARERVPASVAATPGTEDITLAHVAQKAGEREQAEQWSTGMNLREQRLETGVGLTEKRLGHREKLATRSFRHAEKMQDRRLTEVRRQADANTQFTENVLKTNLSAINQATGIGVLNLGLTGLSYLAKSKQHKEYVTLTEDLIAHNKEMGKMKADVITMMMNVLKQQKMLYEGAGESLNLSSVVPQAAKPEEGALAGPRYLPYVPPQTLVAT